MGWYGVSSQVLCRFSFVVNLFWLWVWRILLLFSVVVLWFWCGVCDFGDLAGEVPWVGLV